VQQAERNSLEGRDVLGFKVVGEQMEPNGYDGIKSFGIDE